MTYPTNDNQDDESFFEKAMQDVTPLNTTKKHPPCPKIVNINKHQPQQTMHTSSQTDFAWRIGERDTVYSPEAQVSFKHPGVRLSPLKKTSIRKRIDLHGMTLDASAQVVHRALLEAASSPQRTLAIIHGKGQQGILKSAVLHWLKKHPYVLGFCSAPTYDGGVGCVYVLVKRS